MGAVVSREDQYGILQQCCFFQCGNNLAHNKIRIGHHLFEVGRIALVAMVLLRPALRIWGGYKGIVHQYHGVVNKEGARLYGV
jgi:hypothetical protein